MEREERKKKKPIKNEESFLILIFGMQRFVGGGIIFWYGKNSSPNYV